MSMTALGNNQLPEYRLSKILRECFPGTYLRSLAVISDPRNELQELRFLDQLIGLYIEGWGKVPAAIGRIR